MKLYRSYEMYLLRSVKNYGGDEYSISVHLDESRSLPELKDFINMGISAMANRSLWGFSKKYINGEYCNYEENEWRYIVYENQDVEWLWGNDAYTKWRGSKDCEKPKATDELMCSRLQFDVSDISHIIVREEKEILNLIEFVDGIEFIGGSNRKLTAYDKKILISKMISVDRIENDF